jgi:hypothetical protein
MRTGPVVNAAAAFLVILGSFPGLHFSLTARPAGTSTSSVFIEDDVRSCRSRIPSRTVRRPAQCGDRDQVIFQNFTRPQAGNGDVLLPVIGVDRRVVFDRGAQVLHCVVAGLDHGAVFFEHADVGNVDALVGRVVAELQLPPLLHAGFALHADARDSFFASGAVGLEAIAGRMHLLDDERLLRIVVRLGVRLFLRLGVGSGRSSCATVEAIAAIENAPQSIPCKHRFSLVKQRLAGTLTKGGEGLPVNALGIFLVRQSIFRWIVICVTFFYLIPSNPE